jgi:hypothetical protein
MQIVLASPFDIRINRRTRQREVEYQKQRLLREGQIMPTVVRKLEDNDPSSFLYEIDEEHPDAFHLSSELIQAAVDLDWPTVQVTF